jgi:RimJ/RimL family protein N-acetyltransferase
MRGDPARLPPVTDWPLTALRLTTPDLVLRAMREHDVPGLAARLPDDVELDPSLPAYPGLDRRAGRAAALHQYYGREIGSWSADDWTLLLVAEHDGEVIGSQGLEGRDFPRRRTVETSSYLVAQRGRGLGRQMRVAVLALAFDHLGALAAETEAWHDNDASLGVSRSVGYEPNGETLHVREGSGAADRMVRLRLTRERWEAGGLGRDVLVEGLQTCLPLFGQG